MLMDQRQRIARAKAIEKQNKQKLLSINSELNDKSGIYFLTRQDESGFKYGYIGQAKHILTRLAQHLNGYQHIDLSIKKHGLYSQQNVFGWRVNFLNFPVEILDQKEQEYIKKYADHGYQMRNKTGGGQGEGKVQIDEYRPVKTYREGVWQGWKNASKEMDYLFEKHLTVQPKNTPPTKNQEKALQKFMDFLDLHKGGDVE